MEARVYELVVREPGIVWWRGRCGRQRAGGGAYRGVQCSGVQYCGVHRCVVRALGLSTGVGACVGVGQALCVLWRGEMRAGVVDAAQNERKRWVQVQRAEGKALRGRVNV